MTIKGVLLDLEGVLYLEDAGNPRRKSKLFASLPMTA